MSIHNRISARSGWKLGISLLLLLIAGQSPQVNRYWQTFTDQRFDIDSDGMLEQIALQWRTSEIRGIDYRLVVKDFGYGGSPVRNMEFDLDGKPDVFEISDVDDDGDYELFLETVDGNFRDKYRFRGNVRDGFELPVLASTRYSR
jgi:hypothetical protein